MDSPVLGNSTHKFSQYNITAESQLQDKIFALEWMYPYSHALHLVTVIYILYVQEVVTQPKILNRTILYNLDHVT